MTGSNSGDGLHDNVEVSLNGGSVNALTKNDGDVTLTISESDNKTNECSDPMNCEVIDHDGIPNYLNPDNGKLFSW